MMNKKIPTPLFIVFATIFCLIAGIAGSLLVRTYLPTSPSPSTGSEMSISQDSLRRANLIIENAKKIVVEQDNKVKETAAAGRNSIVGIFKKKKDAPKSVDKKFSINDYYQIYNEDAEGLIVTSDGWIIAPNPNKELSNEEIIKDYVVVTKSRDIYSIDRIEKSGTEPYVFMHLAAVKDLPVKQLSSYDSLSEGQMLVAVNWEGKSYLTSLFEKNKQDLYYEFSDNSTDNVVLSDNLSSFFTTAFIFSLNGEVAAIYDRKTGVSAIGGFLPMIKGLLEKNEFKQPSLGVTYVDLSSLAIKDSRYEKGVMIVSDGKKPAVENGSAAAEAGLKEGDVILSVSGVSVNSDNHLSSLIQKYQAGDDISLMYWRDGQERMVNIKLKEIKKQ